MIGSGYVGLVSGACLADFGHDVTCVDKDATRIEALRRGVVSIFEPGLADLVASNAKARRLTFTTDLTGPVSEADVVFIAVGTPSRRGDGYADLSFVYAAAEEIAPVLNGFTIVATKSTVPVGTGDEIERIIRRANPGADVVVVSNPEFLREGAAIEDFKHPDRIVVGLEDERGRDPMTEVYRPIYLNKAPVLFMSRRTAELTKYASNAFLAMKVTFINEMASLCEAAGADVQRVAHAIGLDRRIGSKFLHAGPGFGGSCFPKDTRALIQTGRDYNSPLRLVETTVAVNEDRKHGMARKVIDATGGSVSGKTLGLLGLTFKPNTDDMREASSLPIIAALQEAGATVRAYDPEGMAAAEALTRDVTFSDDPYAAAAGASALVIVTEWNAFRALDFERLKQTMADPVLVDLRNIYEPHEVTRHGFRYVSIGRPAALP
jgi:UDPglucose 6-dehydrogenase